MAVLIKSVRHQRASGLDWPAYLRRIKIISFERE
jgi:hypothetical protein